MSKSAAIAGNEARAKKEEVAIDELLGQAGCVSASPRSVVRRHQGLVARNARGMAQEPEPEYEASIENLSRWLECEAGPYFRATKQTVLDMKASLDKAGIVHQDPALRQAAGQGFYNTSKFTLRDLKARASQQRLRADFEAYLDDFSPNVQDILDSFEFRNQIPRLSRADALGTLIEKILSPDINLIPTSAANDP